MTGRTSPPHYLTEILKDEINGTLNGEVAVVTGGNSGIGLATARRFVAEGAKVFVTGRRQTELDTAVAEIGGDIIAVRSDISKLSDLDWLYEVVAEKAGRVDVLFTNAGLEEFVPLAQITEEHFDKTFDVNVKGTLFTVQKARPLMSAGGSIIITGSTAGNRERPPSVFTEQTRRPSGVSRATGSST